MLHALYGCSKLPELWNKKPQWNHSTLRQVHYFTDLLESIIADNREPELFCWVAWDLWNRRNNLRLGKQTYSLTQVLEKAVDRKIEYAAPHMARSAAAVQCAHWLAPAPSWYKINFHGAIFEREDSAGLGVVIRNSEGLVMASLSQLVPLPFSVIEVEALAARRALELTVEIGLDRVILEGVSSVLIHALQSKSRPRAQFSHLPNDISFLGSHFTGLKFSHIRRHYNRVLIHLQEEQILPPLPPYQSEWKMYH